MMDNGVILISIVYTEFHCQAIILKPGYLKFYKTELWNFKGNVNRSVGMATKFLVKM